MILKPWELMLCVVIALDLIILSLWFEKKFEEPAHNLKPGVSYDFIGKDGKKYTVTVPKLKS